ncbi:hypothetical protein RvY_16947 [Ramazzottius varieornatus]|uniref:RHD domain-containing protein n=1 Tax=Ramazzottius varieornatus TaxID=947166 RepID=A0A1D1W6J5_RAMVA|nr:hypothetical protein RvY_16947 [Ramazzottius varieornatus]
MIKRRMLDKSKLSTADGVETSCSGQDDAHSGPAEDSAPSTSATHGSIKRPIFGECDRNILASSPVVLDRSLGTVQKSAKVSWKTNASPDDDPQYSDDARLLLPLTTTIPAKYNGMELVIERQPERHHRARYQKEGSRGCIRDESGNSCPAVRLKGIEHASLLQIFVATESGKVCPHPMYRLCKAGGNNSTPCRHRTIDGIDVLEIDINPEQKGFVTVDCMAIIKLRNADLEASGQVEGGGGGGRKKRQSGVRLVFRAITRCGKSQAALTLQVCSTPVSCAPLPGVPEIHRLSHQESPASGGLGLIILGRNFLKNDTRMFVQEVSDKNAEEVIWQREVTLERELFHVAHMVAVIPPYHKLLITQPVTVQIIVQNRAKVSEPHPFTYVPDEAVKRLLQHRPVSHLSSVPEQPEAVSAGNRSLAEVRPRCSTIGSFPDYAMASQDGNRLWDSGSSMEQISYSQQTTTGDQPIFLTIPSTTASPAQCQNDMVNGSQLVITYDDMAASTSAYYPASHQAGPDFLQSVEQNELGSIDVSQLMEEAPLSAAQAAFTSDELFDELVKEIMDWKRDC